MSSTKSEPTKVKYTHLLKRIGITKLKPEQKKIVTSILNKKDVLAVLPTGFGKSMCYVLPHLITNRNVIIVSPLVSLIRDQEQKYNKICNTFVLHGGRVSFNGTDGVNVSQDIRSGKTTALIFMTPETLLNRREWITSIDILSIAIDECHCITEWANFRQGYSELSKICSWFIHRPNILAVTATATNNTENTIKTFFQLNDPLVLRVSAVRNDLELFVEQKRGLSKDLKYMEQIACGKTIIYCKTRKDTEKLSQKLRCIGGSTHYHAGLNADKRNKIQDDFASGKYRVIIATNAFGMGVDIPDISTVIHYGVPKDVDGFCQEIGRAARSPSIKGKCYLLWGKADFLLNATFLRNISDPHEHHYQQQKSQAINKYVNNSSVCRMYFLARYFEPSMKPYTCSQCDVCRRKQRCETSSSRSYENFVFESSCICDGV